MRAALFIIIAVEIIWFQWSGYVNTIFDAAPALTEAQALQADASYFFGTFLAAAILDYTAVQFLIKTIKKNDFITYQLILIGLFCASIFSHLIGMVGFFADWALAMQVYDSMGMGILALEAAVFMAYGLDRFLIGDIYSDPNTPKGSS